MLKKGFKMIQSKWQAVLFALLCCFHLNVGANSAEMTTKPTINRPALEISSINVNTSDVATLCQLPGIGLNKGKAIVDYREAHGQYKNISELLNVKGISIKLLTKISPYLTVTEAKA